MCLGDTCSVMSKIFKQLLLNFESLKTSLRGDILKLILQKQAYVIVATYCVFFF